MPKTDLVRRTDQTPQVRNGELVTGATVIQVSQLAMTSPFSGDFQIVDQGRLIVGQNPDLGARMIISNSGIHGYGSAGIHTFGVYSNGDTTHTSGDWFAGNEGANYIAYNHRDGTLGLYSPAGAGFVATRDGSLQAGNAAGAHMLWNSASRALEIRNGEDVRISLADTGDALFDGTIYASSGRIYGDMQIDAKLLVGDTDGPGVTIGKFERYDSNNVLVESSEIMATDAENLPWFHVVAGGGTAGGGWFQVGNPGDYSHRMTYDGSELVFDGTLRARDGEFIGDVAFGNGTLGVSGLMLASDPSLDFDSINALRWKNGNNITGGVVHHLSLPSYLATTLYSNTTNASYDASVNIIAYTENASQIASAQLLANTPNGSAYIVINQGISSSSVIVSSNDLAFYGVSPVSRQLLPTGAGKTVDDVISALQALGLVRQS